MTIAVFLTFYITVSAKTQSTENELKAVAFQKLSLFIEWPAGSFDSADDEFIIGVYGANPFGSLLETVYKDVKIKGRKVKIIYFTDIKMIKRCHLMFISGMGFNELKRILATIGTKPILTIADTEGFSEAGCLINFYSYLGKIRFEINQKAMDAAGFSIDYKLLSVCKIVNPAGK